MSSVLLDVAGWTTNLSKVKAQVKHAWDDIGINDTYARKSPHTGLCEMIGYGGDNKSTGMEQGNLYNTHFVDNFKGSLFGKRCV